MHYAISKQVLGQTLMWHIQRQAIKLFEDFSIFMGILNFEHTKKQSKNCKKKNLKKKKML